MSFSVQNSSLVLVDHFNFKWALNVASPQIHDAAIPLEYRIPFQAGSPGGCFSNVFPSPRWECRAAAGTLHTRALKVILLPT